MATFAEPSAKATEPMYSLIKVDRLEVMANSKPKVNGRSTMRRQGERMRVSILLTYSVSLNEIHDEKTTHNKKGVSNAKFPSQLESLN